MGAEGEPIVSRQSELTEKGNNKVIRRPSGAQPNSFFERRIQSKQLSANTVQQTISQASAPPSTQSKVQRPFRSPVYQTVKAPVKSSTELPPTISKEPPTPSQEEDRIMAELVAKLESATSIQLRYKEYCKGII